MPAIIPLLIKAIVAAVISAALSAATGLISKALAKKRQSKRVENKARENKQNITETTASLPVVYGRARVGCSRIFVGQKLAYAGQETFEEQGVRVTQDTRGEYLYLICAFAVGEIENIDEIYVDNVAISNPKFGTGYRVNLTFSWVYTVPEVFELVSTSGYYKNSHQPVTTELKQVVYEYSSVATQNQFGGITSAGWRKVYKPVVSKYNLYRISNGSKHLIVSFLPNVTSAMLPNAGYGDAQTYELEYVDYNGRTVFVGSGTVNVTADNIDFSQISNNNLTISQDSFVNSEYIYFEERRGTLSQAPNARFLADEVPGYNGEMVGQNIALGYLRFLIKTKGRAAENTPIFGVPEIQADLRGKLIQDTRTGLALTYSNNPAMCIRDYLIGRDYYGCKIRAEDLDEQSFQDAADYCDELITASDGVTQIKRYVLNGVCDNAQEALDNVFEMLESCNGQLYNDLGKWRLVIEKPETPVFAFNVNNIELNTIALNLSDYRTQVNKINARFVSEANSWETDVVTVSNPVFIEQDGGAELEADIELGFTNDYDHAYYLALFKLKSGRVDLTMTFSAFWEAFVLLPGEVVTITLPHLGFNAKEFRVKQIEPDNETGLLKFTVTEYDADVYNNLNIDPSANNITSDLYNPYDVQPPSNVQVKQSFDTNANGEWLTVTAFTFDPSPSQGIKEYVLELRNIGWGDYQELGRSATSKITVNNLSPGVYDLRLKATNPIGVSSAYYEEEIEVFSPSDRPEPVSGFQVNGTSKEFVLKWEPVQQVINNGFYLIRHSRKIQNVSWNDPPTFEIFVPGYQTSITTSQIDGTYMIKAVNAAGLESLSEAVLTLDSPFDAEFALIQTIEEHPFFEGEIQKFIESEINVFEFDGQAMEFDGQAMQWTQSIGANTLSIENNKLKLGGTFLIDDIADDLTIDDLPDGLTIDGWGISNYTVGVYNFANKLDLGGIYKVTMEKLLDGVITALSDLTIDDLPDDLTIDGLSDTLTIDGFGGESNTTVSTYLYVRYTRDNPALNPEWSEWQLLIKNEFVCRAAEFKLEIVSNSEITNIEIEELAVKIWMKNRIDQKRIVLGGPNQLVNYSKAFYTSPESVSLTIDNPATGDYATASTITESGFIINCKNSVNADVNRLVTYTAYGTGERFN